MVRFGVMSVSILRAAKCSAFAALFFAFLAASTFGWSHDSTPQDRDAEAARFVAQKLQTWQDRMNLKEWNIRVQLVRADQLEPKTLGNIHWDTDSKTAAISVLSTQDYTLPWKAMLDDMEFTVVHELVHLELASLPRSDASRRVEEHAVNEIANALLKLARHS
jgi:hypothetical protein